MSVSPVSMEAQIKLTEWRRKAAEGTLTMDEMKDVVSILRAGRANALAASAASKRKTAVKVIPNAEDLLGELNDL